MESPISGETMEEGSDYSMFNNRLLCCVSQQSDIGKMPMKKAGDISWSALRCTEAIVFQFKNVVWIVESFGDSREAHRSDAAGNTQYLECS